MFKSLSLKKLFDSKRFTVIFSVIAAIIFWLIITIVQAPDTEKTISEVPITVPIEGSAASQLGLDVVDTSVLNEKVSVTVKGPNYIVSTLTSGDVSVTASLSTVNAPGNFNLELKASKVTNSEYEITGVNPGNILVSFDYIDTKDFEITAEAEGASAIEGLVAEKAVVGDSKYSTVTVKGPRTEMKKVASVVARATVNKTLSETSSFDAAVVLLDEEGKELDSKAFKFTAADNSEVTTVPISVPISKVKEVPLTLTFKNAPEGFSTSSLAHTMSFNKISIIGRPDIIDSISSISLDTIDFTKLSPTNYTFNLAPVLPDGVKSADSINTVKVTFEDVSYYRTRTFTVTQFNATSSVKGTLKTSIKNVILCGPRSVIRNLTNDNITAYADLTGKTAGDHTVEVTIKAKTNNKVWQVGTYTATITVK